MYSAIVAKSLSYSYIIYTYNDKYIYYVVCGVIFVPKILFFIFKLNINYNLSLLNNTQHQRQFMVWLYLCIILFFLFFSLSLSLHRFIIGITQRWMEKSRIFIIKNNKMRTQREKKPRVARLLFYYKCLNGFVFRYCIYVTHRLFFY